MDNKNELDNNCLDKDNGFVLNGLLGGFKASIDKMKFSFIKQILLGILGGMILAIAFTACIQATKGVNVPGIKTLIMGLLFPGGIILITFLGGGLYTSHCLAFLPTLKKTIKHSEFLKGLFGVLIGNFIGSFFVALIIAAMGLYKDMTFWNAGVSKLIFMSDDIKEGLTLKNIKWVNVFYCFIGVLASGILCNFLVAGTLPISFSTKNSAGIVLIFIFAISFFVISGFQHGPANTFFFWVMILNPIFNSDIRQIQGYELFFLLFLLLNILPAIIGNFIGGGVVLPMILNAIYKDKTKAFFEKYKITK